MKKREIKFVDVEKYSFVIKPRYYFYGWAKSPKILARGSALKALVKAKKLLPKGCNFKIWDCRRTYRVQVLMVESFRRRIRAMHPKMSRSKQDELVLEFGGKPLRKVTRLDSHHLGGSFDLTITDRNGHEMYMGTDHDDLKARAALDYFESKKPLSFFDREARKNRRLLKRVMSKAGFKPYAPEWWHWSYEK